MDLIHDNESEQEVKAPDVQSIRECFDRAPYESENEINDEKTPGENQDILINYFREMGEVHQLTPQEEHDLWKQVDQKVTLLRRHVCQYGFVCKEYLKILSDTEETLSDYFPPSADVTGEIVRDPVKRRRWTDRISEAFTRYQKIFLAGKTMEAGQEREKICDLLEEHPIQQEKLLEWSDVALRYLESCHAGTLPGPEFEKRLLMTLPECEENAAVIEKIRTDLNNLKLRMVETNLRLVINIAKHFQNKGLPLSDLIQEGNLGLMKALEKFDYRLGHHFATYASWWIKQGVSRAISAQARVIRLPIHMLTTIKKMQAAERAFIQEHGAEPNEVDTAQMLEMPVERVRAIKRMAAQCLSFQAANTEDNDNSTLENVLAASDNDNPMKELARKMLRQRLEEALDQLSERERQLISMRYGLDGCEGKSLSEVSAAFNVTRERIRQIEIRALKKLRRHSGGGKFLDDYFL